MMRRAALLILGLAVAPLHALELRGHLGAEQAFYSEMAPVAGPTDPLEQLLYGWSPPERRTRDLGGYGAVELEHAAGTFRVFARAEGLYSADAPERRYLLLNEAAVVRDFESGRLTLGKSVRFWGVLEGYNIVDTFNTKNLLFAPYSPFEKERKYGSWHVGYDALFESGELGLIVKFAEEKQPLDDAASPYFLLPYPYDETPRYEKGAHDPTFFLRYGGSWEALEYAFGLQHGYDSQRTLIWDEGVMRQALHIATKATAQATLEVGETLFKFEGSRTDVSEEAPLRDYYQAGVGAERTFYAFAGAADLSLYLEYYRSDIDSPTELFGRDLFAAFRLAFNDASSTVLTAGTTVDTGTGETIVQAELRRRLFGGVTAEVRAMRIEADDSEAPLHALDGHTSLRAALEIHF